MTNHWIENLDRWFRRPLVIGLAVIIQITLYAIGHSSLVEESAQSVARAAFLAVFVFVNVIVPLLLSVGGCRDQDRSSP